METVFKTHQTENGRWYRAWTEGVLWEDQAKDQVLNLLKMGFVEGVSVMADTHFGAGGPVGVAVKFKGALIPAVIGFDIGCGMHAKLLRGVTGDELTPKVCQELLTELGRAVPSGLTEGIDSGSWSEPPIGIKAAWYSDHGDETLSLRDEYRGLLDYFKSPAGNNLPQLHNGATAEHRDPLSQLGTLGSGNHFFEVSVDELNRVWLVVHSGSRGAGARIGDYFVRRAQDLMKQWFIRLPELHDRKSNSKREDRNLAYLPEGTKEYRAYIAFMQWAQDYAKRNRSLMMSRAIGLVLPKVLKRYIGQEDISFDIHHNYLDPETLIARKGAVHLTPGEYAIIPGAMGARTYIVRGLPGLSESMETCSHGAGRAMSRGDAERTISLTDHHAGLVGVACNSSADTLDEDKGSYKDIDAVIAAQRDLVEPLYILQAKVCLKGKSLKRRKR